MEEIENKFFEKVNEINVKRKSIDEKRVTHITNSMGEYKNSEQNRIVYIVYGTALTNIVAINNLQQNSNVSFFIAAVLCSLAAYVTWLYMERWAFYSRIIKLEVYYLEELVELSKRGGENLEEYFKKLDPQDNYQKIKVPYIEKNNEQISKGTSNFERYNNAITQNQKHTGIAEILYMLLLVISWVFSLIAGMCAYVYQVFIPIFWGEIAIYTSLIVMIGLAFISLYKRRSLSLLRTLK